VESYRAACLSVHSDLTLWSPPAELEFVGVKVAVIWVEELTDMLETEILGPAFTVAPEAKPAPFSVTGTAFPTRPRGGEMPVITGITVNVSEFWLGPPES